MYAGSPRSPGVYLAVILFTSWTTTRDFFTYVGGAWRPESGMGARIHDHFRLAAGKNMKAAPQKLYRALQDQLPPGGGGKFRARFHSRLGNVR